MANFKTTFSVWFKRLDWALILAALVEIPRWAVAFGAINEPWIFGVPLAAIITWSMKAGWSRYFRRGGRLILALNIVGLLIATIIITPVLYLMTSPASMSSIAMLSIPVVNLIEFRLAGLNWITFLWALALALGTFLPLIALSAVRAEDARDRDRERTVTKEPKVVKTPEPEKPAPSGPFHYEIKTTTRTTKAAPKTGATYADKLEAYNMSANGISTREIAEKFGVSDRTIRTWKNDVEAENNGTVA